MSLSVLGNLPNQFADAMSPPHVRKRRLFAALTLGEILPGRMSCLDGFVTCTREIMV